MKKKKKNIINKNKKESFMSKLFVDDETFDDENENQEISTTSDDHTSDNSISSQPKTTITMDELKEQAQSNEETFGLDVMPISKKKKKNSFFEDDDNDEDDNFDGFDTSLYKKNKSINGVTIGLIVTIILLVVLIAIALVFYKGSSKKQVEVLNLIGKTQSDAQKWCKDSELDETRCLFTTEFSETIPENQVITQSVTSGEKLNSKSVITFTISDGKDPNYEVEIPDLSNMNSEEIMKFFTENEFENVTFEYEVNPDKPDDSFVSSNITGNKAKRSDAVVILISIKQANDDMEIEVPDFKDYTRANMQAWANKYRINLVIIEDYSDTVDKGKFISQSIKAGETIKVNTKLSITFSKGKKITMEDFTNKSQKEVQSWCDANKIKCTFTDTIYSTVAKGNVTSQSVKKGAMVGNVKSIKFTVSLGDSIEIGNFKDQDFKKLEERITVLNKLGANLKIKKESEITNTKENDNKVLSNSESAKINTEIVVKVYTYQASQVSVPNCTGSEEAYKKSLTDINLKPQRQGEKYSSTPNGNVLGCSITSGKVNEGTTVSYFISKGEYKPNAADFNGKTDNDARNIINNAVNQGASAWKYTSTSEYNSDVAVGITYGCSISGTTLTCKVSKGSQPIVGNYVGKAWGGTDKWDINGNGTVILIIKGHEYSDTVPVNQIISQDVAQGTKVDNTINVGVILSKGVKPLDPPTLQGKLECEVVDGKCTIGGYTIHVTEQSDPSDPKTILNSSCDQSSLSCQVTISKGQEITYNTVMIQSAWFTSRPNEVKDYDGAKTFFKQQLNGINVQFVKVAPGNHPEFSINSFQVGNKVYDRSVESCQGEGMQITEVGCQITFDASLTPTVEIRSN